MHSSFPMETICMEYQNLSSGKNKKNITICHLLNYSPESGKDYFKDQD